MTDRQQGRQNRHVLATRRVLQLSSPIVSASSHAIFDQMKQERIDYMLSKIPRGRHLERDETALIFACLDSAENSLETASTFDLSSGRTTFRLWT